MLQLVFEGLHAVCENRRNFIQHTGTDLWCTPGVRFRAPPVCSLQSSDWRYYPQALSVFPSMQLYTSYYFEDETEMAAAKRRIDMCLSDIHSWMAVNMLKLNTDKTELLYFHSRFPPCLQLNPIQLGSDVIFPSSHAKNIGVIFDSSMSRHINAIVKSGHYHLRNIAKIRNVLTLDTTKILVHAFVVSKIDSYNSLIFAESKNRPV